MLPSQQTGQKESDVEEFPHINVDALLIVPCSFSPPQDSCVLVLWAVVFVITHTQNV